MRANVEDPVLIDEYYNCDMTAFDQLCNRWFGRLAGIFKKFGVNNPDNQELANEVMLKVANTKNKPETQYRREKGDFVGWMSQISRNTLYDWWKRQAVQAHHTKWYEDKLATRISVDGRIRLTYGGKAHEIQLKPDQNHLVGLKRAIDGLEKKLKGVKAYIEKDQKDEGDSAYCLVVILNTSREFTLFDLTANTSLIVEVIEDVPSPENNEEPTEEAGFGQSWEAARERTRRNRVVLNELRDRLLGWERRRQQILFRHEVWGWKLKDLARVYGVSVTTMDRGCQTAFEAVRQWLVELAGVESVEDEDVGKALDLLVQQFPQDFPPRWRRLPPARLFMTDVYPSSDRSPLSSDGHLHLTVARHNQGMVLSAGENHLFGLLLRIEELELDRVVLAIERCPAGEVLSVALADDHNFEVCNPDGKRLTTEVREFNRQDLFASDEAAQCLRGVLPRLRERISLLEARSRSILHQRAVHGLTFCRIAKDHRSTPLDAWRLFREAYDAASGVISSGNLEPKAASQDVELALELLAEDAVQPCCPPGTLTRSRR